MRYLLALILLVVGCASASAAATNTVAVTPPTTPWVGWAAWETFQNASTCAETDIKAVSDSMVATGLVAAGYTAAMIDCRWSDGSRDGSGNLLPIAGQFPSGMASLVTYLAGNGQPIAGIYSDSGSVTCFNPNGPASAGHYNADITTFLVTWGFKMVKWDVCGTSEPTATAFTALSAAWDAVAAAVNSIFVYCDFNSNNVSWAYIPTWHPTAKANHFGVGWRTATDVGGSGTPACTTHWFSITSNFHQALWHNGVQAPGIFPDPDYLQIGDGVSGGYITETEAESQFLLWAEIGAPLLLGCDPRNLTSPQLTFIKNAEVLAIDQDPLAAAPIKVGGTSTGADPTSGTEVWSRPLQEYGTRAVALFNLDGTSNTIGFSNTDLGLTGSFNLRNVATGTNLGSMTSYSTSVASHAAVLLKVTLGTENPTTTYAVNAGGSLSGSFIANTNTIDGTSQSVGNAIDTSAVTSPAPQAVYQGSRVGNALNTCIYPTLGGAGSPCFGNPDLLYYIPNLQRGATYKFRLHFSENWKAAAGQRVFNIFINGKLVLPSFDVYAAAGAQFKAVVQEFTMTVPRGFAAIALQQGTADFPMISGIEAIKQ